MEDIIRKQLVSSLKGHGAHASFEQVIKDFPYKLAGIKPEKLDHSAWSIVFHIHIAQKDILEFSRKDDHVSPVFPGGYWPESMEPSSKEMWNKTISEISKDLTEMTSLISNADNDLFVPFPWGDGQNLFREAIILIDHNSYHVGQLVDLRMLLGLSPNDL